MSVSLESLGIDKLSIEDRLELVHAIWDSIAISNGLPTMSEELGRELDKRWQDHLDHPEDCVSLEEFKADALARLKK
jgi:putative addiction module component (TIGR02574 family)